MRNERGHQAVTLLAGIGMGAALMYFLDPQRGKARRAQARDQASGALRSAKWDLETERRNLRNRARGVASELRSELKSEEVSDDQLEERVRADLGHHVEAMRALEVVADDGNVTLRGDLPERDRKEAISAARKVRGVERVVDELNRG